MVLESNYSVSQIIRYDAVNDLNLKYLNILKGNVHTFYSADTVVLDENEGGDFRYPVKYLNSINGLQLPLANLKFKIGTPIMIPRNSDSTTGVFSDTHAILTNCTRSPGSQNIRWESCEQIISDTMHYYNSIRP